MCTRVRNVLTHMHVSTHVSAHARVHIHQPVFKKTKEQCNIFTSRFFHSCFFTYLICVIVVKSVCKGKSILVYLQNKCAFLIANLTTQAVSFHHGDGGINN